MNKGEVQSASKIICQELLEQSKGWETSHFYLYYPLGNEASLLFFAEKLLQQGKQVAFPKVNGTEMEFYEVLSLTDFQEGSFHIMEPVGSTKVEWMDALVMVPGLVFDFEKNRMGYGKGYYDRYFSSHTVGKRIGIAYENQIEPILEAEPWDIPMDQIVTEKRIIV